MSNVNLASFTRNIKNKSYRQLLGLLKAKRSELLTTRGQTRKNVENQIAAIRELMRTPENLVGGRLIRQDRTQNPRRFGGGGADSFEDKSIKSRFGQTVGFRNPVTKNKKAVSKKLKPIIGGKNVEELPMPPEEKTTFNKNEIFKNKGSSSRPDALDMKRTSDDNNLLGGSDPTDVNMNAIEELVSKIVGRRVRFEDIPDDDPDFKQGDGSIEYPAGRPDLKKGGMTAKSAATTEFKKPLGMKGGGLTRSQKQRIARLTQEYKQKKARKSNGKRTNR